MASLTMQLQNAEYRPCYVTESESVEYSYNCKSCRTETRKTERKALFHRWDMKRREILKADNINHTPEEISSLIAKYELTGYLPSYFDVESYMVLVAIVEYEDGTVDEVEPTAVRFVPGLMNEYNFMEAVMNETGDATD